MAKLCEEIKKAYRNGYYDGRESKKIETITIVNRMHNVNPELGDVIDRGDLLVLLNKKVY